MYSRITTLLLVLVLTGADTVTSEGLRGSRQLQDRVYVDPDSNKTETRVTPLDTNTTTVEEEPGEPRMIPLNSTFPPLRETEPPRETDDPIIDAEETNIPFDATLEPTEETEDTRLIDTPLTDAPTEAPVSVTVTDAPVASPVTDAPVEAPTEETEDEDIDEIVENPTFQVNSAIKYEFFKGQGRDASETEVELLTKKAKTVFRKKLVECFGEKFEKVQEVDLTKVYDAASESLELKFLINVLLAEGHGLTEHDVARCISESDWYSYIHVLMSKGIWIVNKVTYEATGKGR